MCTILFYSSVVDSTAERISHEGDTEMTEYLSDYISHSNPQISRYKSWCTVMGEYLTRQGPFHGCVSVKIDYELNYLQKDCTG